MADALWDFRELCLQSILEAVRRFLQSVSDKKLNEVSLYDVRI